MVDFLGGHATKGGVEILGFEVADKEAAGGEEQGVVGPTGLAEGFEHFGPDVGVALAVFVEQVGFHTEKEADALGPGLQGVDCSIGRGWG